MNFLLPINFLTLKPPISYSDKIYLSGSCFTTHMSRFFANAKFNILENSHGILFNPISICNSLIDVIEKRTYKKTDLFFHNESWHSWFHHSDFSDPDYNKVLKNINDSINCHHYFLKNSNYIIITLGSAFAYYHTKNKFYVSNNHRAPHDWFQKELLSMALIKKNLNHLQKVLFKFNNKLKIIFTISPVRHSRDGVIENNRSKARLIEAVHSMKDCYYFPAYEIVIDELRDYRFYDVDLVHPNYAATQYVWEKFMSNCIHTDCNSIMDEVAEIYNAYNHKPRNENSIAHKKFLASYFEKCVAMKNKFPYLDFEKELNYFGVK